MREALGDVWQLGKGKVICITTNGFVKRNGECVMGRGVAAQAKELFPDLPLVVGAVIKMRGNKVSLLGVRRLQGETTQLVAFPVKHKWWEKADVDLIEQSAIALCALATGMCWKEVYLPKPGCGNGGLNYQSTVQPILKPILDDRFVIVDLP